MPEVEVNVACFSVMRGKVSKSHDWRILHEVEASILEGGFSHTLAHFLGKHAAEKRYLTVAERS